MHDRTRSFDDKAKSAVALILTFTAGFVDIIAYIAVYHSFVAHMTGTTVHLGNDLVRRDWTAVIKGGSILLSFVGGSVFGRAIIEEGARRHRCKVATVTLLLEAALVLVFIWSSPALRRSGASSLNLWLVCSLLALLAAAMGLQTATLTRIGPLTIHTTFVTGMLNKLAQSISEWFFWIHDEWHEHGTLRAFMKNSKHHTAFRNARFMVAIWLMYMIGAVSGTWMDGWWQAKSLYLPVALLMVSAAIDQWRPLSVEEETDES